MLGKKIDERDDETNNLDDDKLDEEYLASTVFKSVAYIEFNYHKIRQVLISHFGPYYFESLKRN